MWRSTGIRLLMMVGLLLLLGGCGSGGGNGDEGSSNWDTMVWDQDDWA